MLRTRPKGKAAHFAMIGLALLFVLASPGKGRSLELGLTPSHVYSLWQGINRSLIIYAQIVSGDETIQAELKAMQPAVFEGKVPADVHALAEKAIARLKGYIFIPSQAPDWLIEYQEISSSPDLKDEGVTPSAVFLISTQLLNAIVDVVIDNTGWEQPVSDFYVTELYSGKTPSDVFGLVDLALRRIEVILSMRQG